MGVERGPWSAARPGHVPTTGVLVLLAVGTAGCTMCPDPFDYSGPVPNGAVTQNDFCARSNGILPLGGSPKPWPTVVDAEAREAGAGEPAMTEPTATESVLRLAESPELPDPNVIDEEESVDLELEESEVR